MMMKPERRISLTTGDMNTKDQRTRMEALKRPLQIFSRKSGKSRGKKKTKNRETERLKEELLKRGNGEERFWEEMVMDFIEQKCPLEMDRIIRKMSEAAALHHKKFLKYIK